jgi:hypothetical protein
MQIARSLLATFLASTAIARAAPLEIPTSAKACEPAKNLTIFDFSMPVPPLRNENGTSVLQSLKSDFKAEAIFRYYDYPADETLPNKTLRSNESDALIAAGYKVGVVFQHHNDNPAKFLEPNIGKQDAEQALALADENRQPFNTAIYFGIDGPEDHFESLQEEYRANDKGPMTPDRKLALSGTKSGLSMIKYYDFFYRYGPKAFGTSDLEHIKPEMMYPLINQYFGDIEAAFEDYSKRNSGNGYKVAAYCTAEMCKLGSRRGIKYIWLSPEGRLTNEYKELFKKPDILNFVQWPETKCPDWTGTPDGETAGFDFSQVNTANPDLGTWDKKRK